MKKIFLITVSILFTGLVFAQSIDLYVPMTEGFQKGFVSNHLVVKGKDRKYFRFFPISKNNRVICHFEPVFDTVGFAVTTSNTTLKYFYKYGRLDFNMNGQECILFVYQDKELMATGQYKDYLFLPFTDATSGLESYANGRYLSLSRNSIEENTLLIDFNKAYNPYCAYNTPDYVCVIPPEENRLPIAIKAGEMKFGKLLN